MKPRLDYSGIKMLAQCFWLQYTCICVPRNLQIYSNLKIVLHKLEIEKLQTNFKMGIQFRNCIALLRILEITLFLKQTPPINTIIPPSAQHSIVYSCCV